MDTSTPVRNDFESASISQTTVRNVVYSKDSSKCSSSMNEASFLESTKVKPLGKCWPNLNRSVELFPYVFSGWQNNHVPIHLMIFRCFLVDAVRYRRKIFLTRYYPCWILQIINGPIRYLHRTSLTCMKERPHRLFNPVQILE